MAPPGLAVHGGSGVSFGVIEGLRALRPHERSLELAAEVLALDERELPMRRE